MPISLNGVGQLENGLQASQVVLVQELVNGHHQLFLNVGVFRSSRQEASLIVVLQQPAVVVDVAEALRNCLQSDMAITDIGLTVRLFRCPVEPFPEWRALCRALLRPGSSPTNLRSQETQKDTYARTHAAHKHTYGKNC